MRLSLYTLAILLLIVTIGPLLTGDPMQTDTDHQLQPPGFGHILGTDLLGRDVMSRTVHGGRLTMLTATGSTLIAVIPGIVVGVLVGSSRGWVSEIIVTALNALLAIPSLVVALVVLTLAGRGVATLMLAVGFSQIAPCTFMVRAALLEVQTRMYVEAARGMGATPWFVFRNHLLPSIGPGLMAYTGVIFSFCILNGAALNFLGLGGAPGVPEWGSMLADGRDAFRSAPWIAVAPGVALTVLVWSVNSLADSWARLGAGQQSTR